MLIIEKLIITTDPSNVLARLTPLEERKEPEEQHQHELQFQLQFCCILGRICHLGFVIVNLKLVLKLFLLKLI